MKKCWMIVLTLLLLLTGCMPTPLRETLGSVAHQPPVEPSQAKVMLELPEDALADVFAGENEAVYTCGKYTVTVLTAQAGDLKATVRDISGYDPEKLAMFESMAGKARRYDFVWTAAGEQGDRIGRASILDDGSFHYCLCVMADAREAGALGGAWNALFASFGLEAS